MDQKTGDGWRQTGEHTRILASAAGWHTSSSLFLAIELVVEEQISIFSLAKVKLPKIYLFGGNKNAVKKCCAKEDYYFNIFSKHRPSGPMLSISRNVHMCVCLSVHF